MGSSKINPKGTKTVTIKELSARQSRQKTKTTIRNKKSTKSPLKARSRSGKSTRRRRASGGEMNRSKSRSKSRSMSRRTSNSPAHHMMPPATSSTLKSSRRRKTGNQSEQMSQMATMRASKSPARRMTSNQMDCTCDNMQAPVLEPYNTYKPRTLAMITKTTGKARGGTKEIKKEGKKTTAAKMHKRKAPAKSSVHQVKKVIQRARQTVKNQSKAALKKTPMDIACGY